MLPFALEALHHKGVVRGYRPAFFRLIIGGRSLCSGSQSVSLVPSAATGTKGPTFAANVSLDETRERDVLASNWLAFAFFL